MKGVCLVKVFKKDLSLVRGLSFFCCRLGCYCNLLEFYCSLLELCCWSFYYWSLLFKLQKLGILSHGY